jgi:hypothetical protein
MGDKINTHKILGGKSKEKRIFARPRRKWKDN